MTWGEVDLRWGITDEQKGEVLPICLAEIERCRPYFIGLLGERYGWVPDAIAPDLVEQEPVAPGVLRALRHRAGDPARGARRTPTWPATPSSTCATRPTSTRDLRDEQPELRELPSPEEIQKFGPRRPSGGHRSGGAGSPP